MIRQIGKIFAIFDRETRAGFFGLFLMMLLATGLEMAGLGLFLPVLHLLTQPDLGGLPPAVRGMLAPMLDLGQDRLALIGSTILLIFFLGKNLFLLGNAYLQGKFVNDRLVDYSRRMLMLYMRRPYVFHLQHNSADLIRNIRQSLSQVFNRGVMPLLQVIMESLVTVGIMLVLLAIDAWASLAVGATLGGILAAYYLAIRRRVAEWGRRMLDHDGRILMWLNQSLGAIKAVKLTGRDGYFGDVFTEENRARAVYLTRLSTLPHVPRLMLEVVAVGGLTLVVALVLARGQPLAQVLPTLGLFALAAMRLMPSLGRILSNLTMLKESSAAVDLVHADFSGAADPESFRRGAASKWTMTEGIVLDGVTFTYPGAARPALADLSLNIAKGESVALVGRSGAGKTTLVDLLLGLLEPDRGRVLADGRDIRTDRAAWQANIGYIPQTIYLIDDSLRRNIALGVKDAEIDEARLAEAIRLAQLADVIAALPAGLETVVGEHGARLSGGQRQRIGIARALYDDPELLVLDEATASLDVETEQEVARAIDSLSGIKTVIVIAHRLSTVRHCHRIVFMADGGISAIGDFTGLQEASQDFRKLVAMSQMPGAIVDGAERGAAT